MVAVGMDLGAKNTKVVIVENGKVLAASSVKSGFDQKASAEEALQKALTEAGVAQSDIKHIIATGAGMKVVTSANETITDISANARGAFNIFPSVRTVIDVGAEEGRSIRLNDKGKVVDFGINEKCAAGAGAFTEAMARALEVDMKDMGKLSLQSTKAVPMNAQCTIFAESEVVSLIHQKTAKEDIIRAVHDAIADRITSMARRVGIEQDVTLVGGVANNIGFVDSMKRNLGYEMLVPKEPVVPEFVSAYGAALLAQDKIGGK